MNFSSPIFIFIFLPVTWLICALIKRNRAQNIILAVLSLAFYAFGGLVSLPLFLVSVAVYYLAGLILMKQLPCGRTVLILTIVLNLLVLCICKYTDFCILNINRVFSSNLKTLDIILPLAISFYTFQGISYVIDTYRNPENGTRDFFDFLLFMSFFPQLIQGPILRFSDFSPRLYGRKTEPEQTVRGIRRFITGLAKKVIISNSVAVISDRVFGMLSGSVIDWRLAWLAGICYALQIYYDFSGYSDMAVGLAEMFGFSISENFRFPYGAASVREFWRRWHISLSSWFRDYVYIPLGGSRKGKLRTRINRMIVFICTGVWHGANWTFVVWGICHGILSDLEDDGIIPVQKLSKTSAGKVLCRIYTLLSVMLLFVIFRADSIADGWLIIKSMFSFRTVSSGAYMLGSMLTGAACFVILLGMLLAGNLAPRLKAAAAELEERYTAVSVTGTVLSLLLFVLCVFAMSRGGFESFIYAAF